MKDSSIQTLVLIVSERLKKLESLPKDEDIQKCLTEGETLLNSLKECDKIKPSLELHNEQMKFVDDSFKNYSTWILTAQEMCKI